MKESEPARTRPAETGLHLAVAGALIIAVLVAGVIGFVWPWIKFERRVRPWRERAGLWHYRAEHSEIVNGCVHFAVEGDVITEQGFVLNDRPYYWVAKMRIESPEAARSESVNRYGERMTSMLRALPDGRLENHWSYIDRGWSSRAYATRIGPDGSSSEGREVLPGLEEIGRRLATETPEELFGEAGAHFWREWWEEKCLEYKPRWR